MNLTAAAQAAGARLLHPVGSEQEPVLTGAASDSREVKPGDLFVCIEGERTDGHRHAAEAVKAGAGAVLARRDPFDGEVNAHVLLTPVMLADDPVRALGALAHDRRLAFGGKVVGVTGTAGKTTVKELLAHVLSQSGPTARSPRNLNTQVGLPVSILAASGEEAFWVMEAGISHPQDMDELGPILEPDLALILNVGAGHSLGLGAKGVAHYKAALLKHLASASTGNAGGGIALVSADYPDLVKETRAVCSSAIFFSITGKQMPYRASYLGINDAGLGMYRLWLDGLSLDVTCRLTGPYAAENVIAVAAAAHLLGLDADAIAAGLASAPLPDQRFTRIELPGENGAPGWSVIDDSYNANPLSTARMLEAAGELARDKTLICVMGEMLELGDVAEEEHVHLGEHIVSARAQAVFWVGGQAAAVREGLAKEHFTGLFQPLSRPEDFLPALEAWEKTRRDNRPVMILFKGSRSNKLERLVSSFMEQRGPHAL